MKCGLYIQGGLYSEVGFNTDWTVYSSARKTTYITIQSPTFLPSKHINMVSSSVKVKLLLDARNLKSIPIFCLIFWHIYHTVAITNSEESVRYEQIHPSGCGHRKYNIGDGGYSWPENCGSFFFFKFFSCYCCCYYCFRSYCVHIKL